MIIDASVWVSAHLRDDVNHVVSRRWLQDQTAISAALVAPTLLLVEVAGAIRRRSGSAEFARRAADEIAAIPGLRLIPLDPPLAMEAAPAAATLALRGVDAVYVAVARRLDLPLVTWDGEIQARASGLIQVTHP